MSQPLRYVVLSTLRPGVIDTVRSAAVGSMEMVWRFAPQDTEYRPTISFSFHFARGVAVRRFPIEKG